jgi:hypothetical protein
VNSITVKTSVNAANQPIHSPVPPSSGIEAKFLQQRAAADSVELAVPFPCAGKSITNLLSNLIEILNRPMAGAIHELPLLESLFYKGEDPLAFLKAFIERSGLLYEAKIAKGDIKGLDDDLKGLIFKILEKHGQESEAGKTANALLNDIEARQLLNLKGKDEGVFCLQIPVMLPQGPSSADVYVRRDGKGKDGYKGDSYRVGFSIELSEAGLVSVDALVSGNNASVTLQAENGEFLEFMRNHLPELSERLSGYGMKVSIR